MSEITLIVTEQVTVGNYILAKDCLGLYLIPYHMVNEVNLVFNILKKE